MISHPVCQMVSITTLFACADGALPPIAAAVTALYYLILIIKELTGKSKK